MTVQETWRYRCDYKLLPSIHRRHYKLLTLQTVLSILPFKYSTFSMSVTEACIVLVWVSVHDALSSHDLRHLWLWNQYGDLFLITHVWLAESFCYWTFHSILDSLILERFMWFFSFLADLREKSKESKIVVFISFFYRIDDIHHIIEDQYLAMLKLTRQWPPLNR